MDRPRGSLVKPASINRSAAPSTRVSTEQGLDQEFNSLDARCTASAYIRSQAMPAGLCSLSL
jgi:hypothetical protein